MRAYSNERWELPGGNLMNPGIARKMLVGISLAVLVGAVSACQVFSDELQLISEGLEVVSDELEALAVGAPEAEVKKCFEEHADEYWIEYDNDSLRVVTLYKGRGFHGRKPESPWDEAVVFTFYRGRKSGHEWENRIGWAKLYNPQGQKWMFYGGYFEASAVYGMEASRWARKMAVGSVSPSDAGTYDDFLALAAKDSFAREVLDDMVMTIVGYAQEGELELDQIEDTRLRERVAQLIE